MNVIISNKLKEMLIGLNIEVIKALNGEFDSDELIGTFSNFFFARMIIDITALKNSNSIVTYQKLSIGLPVDKIILVMPPDSEATNSQFISKLISLGYYNFTTNAEGVQYLLSNPNTYKDVAHLHVVESSVMPTVVDNSSGTVTNGARIIGIKNLTENAGATSLIYMMKKELESNGYSVLALEIGKKDFMFYNDKMMQSTSKDAVATDLLKAKNANIILIDVNDGDENICDEVLYLLEASVLKLNKLIFKEHGIFNRMNNKKVVLNKCVLSREDCAAFENEANIKFFFILPPINDREKNEYLTRMLGILGLLQVQGGGGSNQKGGLFSNLFK